MTKPSRTALFSAARIWDREAVAALCAAAPELIDASDPKGRDSVAIARDRKLPAGIIEKMESLQRKLGKRRH